MKYILAILGVIFVSVLAIILITRDSGPDTTETTQTRKVDIQQLNTSGSAMVYTTYGALVGEQQRRGIRITVTQSERKLEILTGYENTVTTSQIFPNTPAAYDNFLSGIKRAGFTSSQETQITNELGVCPTGRRFNYNVLEYGEELTHLWNSSCSVKTGSFAGNTSMIRRLFQAQIPEYSKAVEGVSLTGKNK